jgi:hypothetical protein
MTEPKELTLKEQADKLNQARLNACRAELQDILDKYGIDIDAMPMIEDGRIVAVAQLKLRVT